MAKIKLDPIYIRYSGLFDFQALYAAIIDWCKNYGFIWEEETFKHKVPSPKGAEQEWLWLAEKEVTDYIKFKINFIPHGWELTEVEVIKEGKKKVLTSGRLEIVMVGEVITDWQKKWEGGRFNQWLGRTYEKMVRREITNWVDTLYYRIWNLQTIIKKFFEMQTKWNEYKRYLKED